MSASYSRGSVGSPMLSVLDTPPSSRSEQSHHQVCLLRHPNSSQLQMPQSKPQQASGKSLSRSNVLIGDVLESPTKRWKPSVEPVPSLRPLSSLGSRLRDIEQHDKV